MASGATSKRQTTDRAYGWQGLAAKTKMLDREQVVVG